MGPCGILHLCLFPSADRGGRVTMERGTSGLPRSLELPPWVRRWNSPHFTPGRRSQVELVVIHAISLPQGQFGTGYVMDLFMGRLDPQAHPSFRELEGLKVSCHFFVERTGQIHQFVDPRDTAWHAGMSEFLGRTDCNDFSIGIELEGAYGVPFTEEQYSSLELLLRALVASYPLITSSRVVGHEHISPGRKWDPGPSFSWERVRAWMEEIERCP